MYFERQGQQR